MADPVSWLVVERGWRVLARDGSEVGRVDELVGDTGKDIFNGLTVSSGLFGGARYVPAEAVNEIREGEVELALSPDEVERLEAYEPPGESAEIRP